MQTPLGSLHPELHGFEERWGRRGERDEALAQGGVEGKRYTYLGFRCGVGCGGLW